MSSPGFFPGFPPLVNEQEPGEAFLIPPNNKVPYSSINHTREHMRWLYQGNRHDKAKKYRLVSWRIPFARAPNPSTRPIAFGREECTVISVLDRM